MDRKKDLLHNSMILLPTQQQQSCPHLIWKCSTRPVYVVEAEKRSGACLCLTRTVGMSGNPLGSFVMWWVIFAPPSFDMLYWSAKDWGCHSNPGSDGPVQCRTYIQMPWRHGILLITSMSWVRGVLLPLSDSGPQELILLWKALNVTLIVSEFGWPISNWTLSLSKATWEITGNSGSECRK